ncbi:MAG: acyl carrier protein [Epulopiscium sp.]|nr:acyl carrier protein [Candidatus Epulonipiscium sp.]
MKMIFEKVKKVVVEQLGVDENEIKMESSFQEDLGADSLDLFEIVMSFEEEFGMEISNEDVEKIKTIQDAVAYIGAKQ